MTRKIYENESAVFGRTVGAAFVAAVIVLFVLLTTAQASPHRKSVTLSFVDSAMVNDTLIRIGDIAAVRSDDAALAARVRNLSAGESAPAGFSRYINSSDLVIYRIQPQFKDVTFTNENTKRVKVTSNHQERAVGEFEELIRAYVSEKLGWAESDWTLTINNPRSTWKSGYGALEVSVTGIDNPFTKGNTSLTLVARHGSRVNRVPVSCRIEVRTKVLVAARQIRRGEELTNENSKFAVMNITNFAYAPLLELPKSGTMTAGRTISAGSIVHGRQLNAVPTVARGDQVRIHFIGERVKISVIGVARDSGRVGDRIWVENSQTGKLIRAAVSGKGSVVVHQEGGKS